METMRERIYLSDAVIVGYRALGHRFLSPFSFSIGNVAAVSSHIASLGNLLFVANLKCIPSSGSGKCYRSHSRNESKGQS